MPAISIVAFILGHPVDKNHIKKNRVRFLIIKLKLKLANSRFILSRSDTCTNSSSNLQFMNQFHVTDNFRTPDEQLSMFRCLDELNDLRAHTM